MLPSEPRFTMLFPVRPGAVFPLNDLERAVLTLRAQGYRNSEIADQLSYSRAHIKNVMLSASHKLGTHSATQSVLLAMRQGQISRLLRRPDRGDDPWQRPPPSNR